MINNKLISVVIPSFKVAAHIKNVIENIPKFVDFIIVIDDQCPQETGQLVESYKYDRVHVVYNKVNLGVGGAVVNGYKKALALNSEIVVKIDGDGQMNTEYMHSLIQPILEDKADYSKGNRFSDFKALKSMPKVRLFGNSALSFLIKMASGYWNMMDPTNGYTAISKKAIEGLELDDLSKRYFFESDLLIHLNIENCVVKDIPIPAQYGDEESSLKIRKVLFDFPPRILKGFLKRLFYRYYIYDFNMASIYMIIGFPLFMWGILFGGYRWIMAIVDNFENTTGTVMLSVLPIILGVQFLLQAVNIDIDNNPKKDK